MSRWLVAICVSGCAAAPISNTSYAEAFGEPSPVALVTLTAARQGRASPPPPWQAQFLWPIDPVVVTSAFGTRPHPLSGDYQHHSGIDLAAETAQPVYAAFAGTVTAAGWHGGYGNEIELRHDRHWETRYGHLDTCLVKPGQRVERGQLLGLAGSTGQSTGVHLHFELLRDGLPIDPEARLRVP